MLIDTSRSSPNIISNLTGVGTFFDNTRNKILSISRSNVFFGIDHKNITGKRWMRIASNVSSSTTGYKIPRNGTITAVTIQTGNNVINASFNIRINNFNENILSLVLRNQNDLIEDNLNIDITHGDYIQLFLSVLEGTVDYPIVNIELAWR